MSKLIALLCAAAMTVSAGASLAFAADKTTTETAEAAATETVDATEEATAEAEATEKATAEAEATETATEEATTAPTEDTTEEPTTAPTEDATEEPTTAPTEEAEIFVYVSKIPAVNPFEDCQDQWFTDAVAFVYNNGLIKGYDNVTFGPQDNVTRDQLAVILYRLNSTDDAATEGENWAAEAEAWVSETGIMDEFLGEAFNGSENLTREQIISAIYKAYKLGYEAQDASAQDLGTFVDSELITDYAVEAVKWAVLSGIIEGNDDMEINPADNVTRAETAAILQRYLTKLTFADPADEEATEPEETETPTPDAEATVAPAEEETEAPAATEEPEEEEATEEPVEEVAE